MRTTRNAGRIIAAVVKASPAIMFKAREHGWRINWTGNNLFGLTRPQFDRWGRSIVKAGIQS